MPGPSLFEEPGGSPMMANHRRLLACVTTSALMLVVAILTINVSLKLDFSGLIPAVLDVTLRKDARPEPVPAPDLRNIVEPGGTTAAEEEPPAAAVTTPRPAGTPATVPSVEAASPTAGAAPVDWYAELEHAAAKIVDEHSTAESLHPEFDELRRIAAERYAPAASGAPRPIWENVERDIYGRTLLRSGNCFRVLDDPNVGNRYAFETFEQYLVQCAFSFGKKRGKNLPWVATIRARYNHLRDPDGSRSVPSVASPTGYRSGE